MKILILDSITLGDDISLDKLKELGEVITYPQSSREEAKQRITEHNPEVIFAHTAVFEGSAKSIRLRIIRRGFPAAMSSISGLRDTCGMRASTTSHTASTCLIYSAI